MGFKKEAASLQIDARRLSALAGGGVHAAAPPVEATAPNSGAARRGSVEPDLSRINKSRLQETPAERKKRLAAKTMNFGASFFARMMVVGALGVYGYELYNQTYAVPNVVAIGLLVMAADFVRLLLKAMEPGSK